MAFGGMFGQRPQREAPREAPQEEKISEERETLQENKVDPFEKLWDNDSVEGENQPQQPEKDTRSSDQILQDYRKGLNFLSGVDVKKIGEDLGNGDTESLQHAFAEIAWQVHSRTLAAANEIVQKRVDAAVEKATQQALSRGDGRFAMKQMQDRLPFTKEAAMAPVANAVLQRFLDKGQGVDEAVGNVQEYFRRSFQNMNKVFGSRAPQSRAGNGRVDAVDSLIEELEEEGQDWFDTLSSGAVQNPQKRRN